MATAHVIPFKTPALPLATHLDLNNGHLYDKGGNEIGKWAPKDATTKEARVQLLCAQLVASEHRALLGAAYRSPHQAANELAAAVRGQQAEAHALDLGTTDVHLPSALPNFAGGYRNEPPMADMASAPLLVDKPADKYFIFDKDDAYQLALPTAGAPAGQVPEIPPRLANFTFTTVEYALGGFVPTEIEAAADAPLRIRQATSKRILNALLMRREQRVVNQMQTSGTWDSSVVTTLGAGFQWNGGASSDPVKDIHAAVDASLGTITAMVMSLKVFHAFQRNPAVQKYFTYKSGSAPMPDAGQMTAILELPKIYVAKMKIKDTTGAYPYVWGNHVVFIRQPDQVPPMTQDDLMSNCTFRWKAANLADGVVSGGFFVREFFNQVRGTKGGSQMVVGHHDVETQLSKFAGGLLINAWQ